MNDNAENFNLWNSGKVQLEKGGRIWSDIRYWF